MMTTTRLATFFCTAMSTCLTVGCGESTPGAYNYVQPPPAMMDVDTATQIMDNAIVPSSTTPCPPLSRPPQIDDYARAYYLAEHPNPACSRNLVCTPLAISSSLPLCQWRPIAIGDEDRQTWVQLGGPTCAVPGTIGQVDAHEFDGTKTADAKFQTCSWNLYSAGSPTQTLFVETKTVPGVPEMAPSHLARLRYTAARAFVTDTCPVTDERTRNWPYNANCWLWAPARR